MTVPALAKAPLDHWHALLQAGQPVEALTAMEQWISAHPEDEIAVSLTLIRWLLDAGASAQAFSCVERLLALDELPASTRCEVLDLKAQTLSSQGDYPGARLGWLEALTLEEQCLSAWIGLATLLDAQQYTQEATEAWKRAAGCDGAELTPYLRWAQGAQTLGQAQEAVDALSAATTRWPQDALLFLLKGAAHDGANQPKAAAAAYQQAQALSGSDADFHQMAAQYFAGRGETARSTTHWVELLLSDPANETASRELARLLLAQQRPEEAIALLTQTIKACTAANQPCADLWIQLGHAQGDLGLVNDALASFDQAMALSDPLNQGALQLRKALSLPVIAADEASAQQAFARAQMAIRTLAKFPPPLVDGLAQIGATPYFFSLQDEPLAPTMRWFNQALAQLPVLDLTPPVKTSGDRPTIGIVSRYWQAGHGINTLCAGVFEQLDRSRFQVVWIKLGTTTPDRGLTLHPDDRWVTVPVTDEATMAGAIAACHLDGLIYADAGLEPAAFYLSRHRLARRQAMLGSAPMTTGFPSVDSVFTGSGWLPLAAELVDATETPRITAIGLPAFFKRPTSGGKPRWREDYGFTAQQQVAVLGAPLYKLSPSLDGLLEQLLLQHPQLMLVVREAPVRGWSAQLQARWETSLSPEARARIRWLGPVSPDDWQALLGLADVVLDSLPTHDPVTSVLALGLGTPVVALAGRFARQRLTTGLLTEMGLDRWSVSQPDQWLAAVTDILGDPIAAREQVAQAQPRGFERHDWVEAFDDQLQRWLLDEAPCRLPQNNGPLA